MKVSLNSLARNLPKGKLENCLEYNCNNGRYISSGIENIIRKGDSLELQKNLKLAASEAEEFLNISYIKEIMQNSSVYFKRNKGRNFCISIFIKDAKQRFEKDFETWMKSSHSPEMSVCPSSLFQAVSAHICCDALHIPCSNQRWEWFESIIQFLVLHPNTLVKSTESSNKALARNFHNKKIKRIV